MFLLARILHVVMGTFWVGAMLFSAFYLLPSMREAGPDAAKVGAGISKRRLVDVMPTVALITVLSGFWLYWTVSGGFSSEYMGSGPGIWYGIGAVAALVALTLGIAIVRSSMVRADRLGQSAQATSSDEERGRLMGEAQALRGRAAKTSVWVALILVVATAAMAVARYM